MQRGVLRDRPALKQWSKGRATLVGMSIEDGSFPGRTLRVSRPGAARRRPHRPASVSHALQSYKDPRKPHTARQVQQAFLLGKVFHPCPALLRPICDLVFDCTPFL